MILTIYLVLLGISICLFLLTAYYNRLTYLHNQTTKRWQHIEQLFQKKIELTPRLVFVLGTHRDFDHTILTQLQMQQNDILNSKTYEERSFYLGLLETSLKHVYHLAENHPKIHTDQAFLQLQHSLFTLDTELSKQIKHYNKHVREYNRKIKVLPGRTLVWLFDRDKDQQKVSVISSESRLTS